MRTTATISSMQMAMFRFATVLILAVGVPGRASGFAISPSIHALRIHRGGRLQHPHAILTAKRRHHMDTAHSIPCSMTLVKAGAKAAKSEARDATHRGTSSTAPASAPWALAISFAERALQLLRTSILYIAMLVSCFVIALQGTLGLQDMAKKGASITNAAVTTQMLMADDTSQDDDNKKKARQYHHMQGVSLFSASSFIAHGYHQYHKRKQEKEEKARYRAP